MENVSLYIAKSFFAAYAHSPSAEDPHSFFVDPDPAVFLNAGPDPDADLDPKPTLQNCV